MHVQLSKNFFLKLDKGVASILNPYPSIFGSVTGRNFWKCHFGTAFSSCCEHIFENDRIYQKKNIQFLNKNVILEVEEGMIWSIFPIELWFRDMLVHHVTPCDKSRNKCYDFRADAGTQFVTHELDFQTFSVSFGSKNSIFRVEIQILSWNNFLRHGYRANIWYRRCFTGGFNA